MSKQTIALILVLFFCRISIAGSVLCCEKKEESGNPTQSSPLLQLPTDVQNYIAQFLPHPEEVWALEALHKYKSVKKPIITKPHKKIVHMEARSRGRIIKIVYDSKGHDFRCKTEIVTDNNGQSHSHPIEAQEVWSATMHDLFCIATLELANTNEQPCIMLINNGNYITHFDDRQWQKPCEITFNRDGTKLFLLTHTGEYVFYKITDTKLQEIPAIAPDPALPPGTPAKKMLLRYFQKMRVCQKLE